MLFRSLPFGDATFDAVLLIQVFGGLDEWRPFVGEARRVLRSRGSLVLGRGAMPEDGVDARMKDRLDNSSDSLDEELQREENDQAVCLLSADFREGYAAFSEKRPADFVKPK